MNHLDKYMDTHTQAFLETTNNKALRNLLWRALVLRLNFENSFHGGRKNQKNRRNNSWNKNQNNTKKN